jgi:hypothetical protein
MAPEANDAPPLADIEVGFSVEQAGKIVSELDALWAHSTRDGKKKVHELRRLRETLTAALADDDARRTETR